MTHSEFYKSVLSEHNIIPPVMPIVFLDGLVVHIRNESGRVFEYAMYVAIESNFLWEKKSFLAYAG